MKILIWSYGSIGKRYVEVINTYWPKTEIGVLRRANNTNKKELLNSDGKVFTSLKESLIWRPDACIICSPATHHIDQALMLMKHRIPVLIEKPIGTGEEIVEKKNKLRKLSMTTLAEVGYIYRCHPLIEKLRGELEINRIGKLVDADFYCGSWLPEWREIHYKQTVSAQKKLGGGALLELSHELDLAQYLLGELCMKGGTMKPGKILEVDVEESAAILCTSKKCRQITIRINFCTKPSRRNIILRGTEGEIVVDLVKQEMVLKKDDYEKRFTSTLSRNELFRIQIAEFMEQIKRRSVPRCSCDEGLKVLELIEEVRNLNE